MENVDILEKVTGKIYLLVTIYKNASWWIDRSIDRGIVVLRWVRSENNNEGMVEIKGK